MSSTVNHGGSQLIVHEERMSISSPIRGSSHLMATWLHIHVSDNRYSRIGCGLPKTTVAQEGPFCFSMPSGSNKLIRETFEEW
jgi:hypothetical protein